MIREQKYNRVIHAEQINQLIGKTVILLSGNFYQSLIQIEFLNCQNQVFNKITLTVCLIRLCFVKLIKLAFFQVCLGGPTDPLPPSWGKYRLCKVVIICIIFLFQKHNCFYVIDQIQNCWSKSRVSVEFYTSLAYLIYTQLPQLLNRQSRENSQAHKRVNYLFLFSYDFQSYEPSTKFD